MLLLWIIFVIQFLCLSCFVVCLLQPCGHLLGKDWPLGYLVCVVLLCFDAFPLGVLGQMWYLIVSIPDLCFLTYIESKKVGKDQELIQSSTTPDPGHCMGK